MDIFDINILKENERNAFLIIYPDWDRIPTLKKPTLSEIKNIFKDIDLNSIDQNTKTSFELIKNEEYNSEKIINIDPALGDLIEARIALNNLKDLKNIFQFTGKNFMVDKKIMKSITDMFLRKDFEKSEYLGFNEEFIKFGSKQIINNKKANDILFEIILNNISIYKVEELIKLPTSKNKEKFDIYLLNLIQSCQMQNIIETLTNETYRIPIYIDTDLSILNVLAHFYGLNIIIEKDKNINKIKDKFNKYGIFKLKTEIEVHIDGNSIRNKFPSLYELNKSDFLFKINTFCKCYNIQTNKNTICKCRLNINKGIIILPRICKRDLQIINTISKFKYNNIFVDYMSFLRIFIPDEQSFIIAKQIGFFVEFTYDDFLNTGSGKNIWNDSIIIDFMYELMSEYYDGFNALKRDIKLQFKYNRSIFILTLIATILGIMSIIQTIMSFSPFFIK
jgi:hypothetical protein